MVEIVTAVYEKGMLRPLQPLNLQERQTVRIQVLLEEPVDRVEKVIQKLVKAGVITPPPGHSEVDPVSEEERRETMVQSLRQARLTSPLADTLLQPAAPISPARRAELAQALAIGKPLSEIVIEERAERW